MSGADKPAVVPSGSTAQPSVTPAPLPASADGVKPGGGTTGMGGPSERPQPPMQTFTRVQNNESDSFVRREGPSTSNPKSSSPTPGKE